jgi:hypothetical protein
MTLEQFMKKYMKYNQNVSLYSYSVAEGYKELKVLGQVCAFQNGYYGNWEMYKILRVLKGDSSGIVRIAIKKPRKKLFGLF